MPIIPPSTGTAMPIFSDDFDGPSIDTNLWDIYARALEVQDGSVRFIPETNDTGDWAWWHLRAAYPGRFQTLEARVEVNSFSNQYGRFGFNTSCSDTIESLFLRLDYNGKIIGSYGNGGRIDLNWKEQRFETGRAYIIRLVQDENMVRAYVDGVLMSETYPCDAMGDWFHIGVALDPMASIEARIDYVKLWGKPIFP